MVGSAGLGYHTVKQLALKNAKVYLVARSPSRADAAVKRLLAECPSVKPENLVWLPLDLGDQSQVASAAKDFLQKETRLDILGELDIRPAGVIMQEEPLLLTLASTQRRPQPVSLLLDTRWLRDGHGCEVSRVFKIQNTGQGTDNGVVTLATGP